MVDACNRTGAVIDRDACLSEVLSRETVASTGMQNGIALPHAKTDTVSRMTVAIGIHRTGCDFDSLDGEPARIFVMCLSPKDGNSPHIECLAAIGACLCNQDTVKKILEAKNAAEVCALFRQ